MGGQGYWGINTNLKYEAGTGYTYSKSDHTSAYDISTGAQNDTNRTLRYYHRNYVNLGGTTVVLYDRIQAKVASYTKEMRFHLHKQSTNSNSGGIIQSTVGSSRVFIKPISPTGTLTLDTSNIASDLPRVRVIPPTAVTDWNPLTVIATGSSSASMPTTTAIDTTAMSGVVVSEVIPKIIMFSKSGTQQNAVTYTASYTAGTTGNHLLVDMEPGMYDIYRDGGKIISGAVASGQGVLSFSMTGGTLFQAVKTGTVPIETTAPVVTGFALPASATSLTVEISAFTASDANGVAGYLITESAATPSAAVATGWKTSAPTTFTFSGTGARTAYAWAKDAAGNVSKSVSATVTITLPPDLIAPAVTSFTMPSTASSLTVSVSSFTATDDTAVSGYIITENASPPQASAAGWSTTAPASFTFAGYGSGTAYAWAKDFAGNVSSSVSANCLIEPAFAFIAVAEGAVAKGSGTTLSTSSTLNVLAGDLLVAAVHWEEGTGGTIGVTDGSSNVFTMTPEVNSSGQAWAAFGYKISASANAAATFKFTNSSAAVYRHLYVYQFRPAPGATVSLDPTTTNPAIGSGNSASPVGGTITTKGTDTVVIGSVKSYSDTSHSAHKIGGVAADGSTSDGLWSSIWYRLLSSPMASGYAQATLSYATTWVCGTIGFKASSGTPSPPTGLKPIIVK